MQSCHDLKGVGDIEYVGFAAGPSTIGIQIDCPAFIDEAPADHVRFLAVATGGKSFWMPRSRPRLADLIEMGHESQDCLTLARLVDERLATSKRGARAAQKLQNCCFRLGQVCFSVCLLFAPSSSGDK